jgi:hypothetical protein
MMELAEKKASKSVHASDTNNAERWDKTHRELDLHVGDLVLISTVNFNNLGGNKKVKDNFVGPFVVKAFHGKNAVEVILTKGFDLKHPTFPISLVKKYVKEGPFRQEESLSTSVPPITDETVQECFPCKILDKKIIRNKGQDKRLYLTRFKDLTSDLDRWMMKEDIPGANKLLRTFRATMQGKTGSGIREILFRGGECQPSSSAAAVTKQLTSN